MTKKLLTLLNIAFIYVFLLIPQLVSAQTCASTSIYPYQWPSHKNWFVSLHLWDGQIINMSTGGISVAGKGGGITVGAGPSTAGVQAYEGVSAASNDQGNLLFYTNGDCCTVKFA